MNSLIDDRLSHCQKKGHDSKKMEYLCLFPECPDRDFICIKCLPQHKHKEINPLYLPNLAEKIKSNIKRMREIFTLFKKA